MKSLGIPLLTGVALAFCGTVDAMSTVDSWFDPQVEFLEIGTVVNGGVPTLKVYGPDASGVYGGLGGVGGLERLEIYGHINQVFLFKNFFATVFAIFPYTTLFDGF